MFSSVIRCFRWSRPPDHTVPAPVGFRPLFCWGSGKPTIQPLETLLPPRIRRSTPN